LHRHGAGGRLGRLSGRRPGPGRAGAVAQALWLAGVLAASLAAYFYWLHLREWTLRHGARPAPGRAPWRRVHSRRCSQ
jgi:hypothetical protein